MTENNIVTEQEDFLKKLNQLFFEGKITFETYRMYVREFENCTWEQWKERQNGE